MEWYVLIVFLIGGLLILLALGLPIAFSFLLLNFIGAYIFMGGTNGLALATQQIFTSLTSFTLSPIPLFILMGEILNRGGCGEKLVEFSERLVGGLTGGLAHANIVASMFFGGISGVATADTAAIGSVLIPTMTKSGYDAKFATVVTVTSSIIARTVWASSRRSDCSMPARNLRTLRRFRLVLRSDTCGFLS